MLDTHIVSVSVDRASHAARAQDHKPRVTMLIDRGLRSGKLDVVPLTRGDLISLICQASSALAVLEGEPHQTRGGRMTRTVEQRAILARLLLTDGKGAVLARDVAADCGIAPRSMGAKLSGLEHRGLARRRLIRKGTPRSDSLYGWEITDAGRAALDEDGAQ